MSTVLVPDNERAFRVGYEAVDWPAPLEYARYHALVSTGTGECIVRDGECVGAVLRFKGEVHVCIYPAWRRRWATKGLLRQILAGPRVQTRVAPGHDYMHGILQRLGFQRQNEDTYVKEN